MRADREDGRVTDITTPRSNPLWSRVFDRGFGVPKKGGAKRDGTKGRKDGERRVSSKEVGHAEGEEEGTGSSGAKGLEIWGVGTH